MNDLTELETLQTIEITPVIDYSVRNLCCKPYSRHPEGCCNYGKRDTCPPQAPLFDKKYDMAKPVYAIIYRLDYQAHVQKMMERWPDGTPNNWHCCLYWQNTARSKLRREGNRFLKEHPGYHITLIPEAMGVNVVKTIEPHGFIIEWPPDASYIHKIAFAGVLRRGSE